MDLRAQISEALKTAMRDKDQARLSTLRLVNAAIKDRDIALRGEGGDRAETGVVDWGTAEAMAYGSLLLEGNHVRINPLRSRTRSTSAAVLQ